MDHELSRPLAHAIPDAARAIGIGRSAVYELIADGRLDARKLGGRTVITDESLRELIASAPKADIRMGRPKVI